MFYNWYQTGSSLELYNPNNKDILSQWSFVGNVQKIYDKSIKSHIHSLHSGSLCKMILPKNNSTSLGIVQGFMVFQLYLFHLKNFSIEIAISDTQKTKHRLIFSTHLKDFNLNYFSALIPLGEFPIGVWVNFSVDVLGFVTHCFKGMTFKSIDSVMVSADCKIRRIFTMRGKIKLPELESEGNVSSSNNNNEIESDIPKKMKIETTDKGVSVICVNYNVEVVKRYLLGVYGNYSEPKEVVTNNNNNNKRKNSKDCSFSNNTNSNNSSFTYINSGSSYNNSKLYNKSKSKSPPNEKLNLRVVGEKQYPNVANAVKAIQQQQQPQIKIKKRSPNNSKERNVKRYQTDNSVNNTQNNNNNNKGNVSSIESKGNKISNKEDITNVVKFNNFNLEKGNVAGSIEELIESQQREQQQVIQTSLSNIKGVQLISQSTTSNNNNKSNTLNKQNNNHHELFPSSSLNDGGIDLTKSRERPYSPPLSKIINN